MNMEFHHIGNYAGILELFLPFNAETLADFESVPNAIRDWQDLDSNSVSQHLRYKFRSITTPSVERFCEFFQSFKPVSVLEYDGAWQFRFSNSPEIADFSWGTNFFLPAGGHNFEHKLEVFSEGYDIQCPDLIEFFTNFHGLTSSPFSQGFTSDFSPFSFLGFEIDDNWDESVILFYAGNGDLLLMNEEQEVSWWYHETNEIGFFAGSFTECLEKFTEFKISYLDYFDAYTVFNPELPRGS